MGIFPVPLAQTNSPTGDKTMDKIIQALKDAGRFSSPPLYSVFTTNTQGLDHNLELRTFKPEEAAVTWRTPAMDAVDRIPAIRCNGVQVHW